MAGELAAEWIKIPDGNGNLQKVWVRDSTARRDIAQLQTDVSGKADAATTLAGYGITDAYTKTQVDGMIPSVPSAYTSNPEMDGTASPGSSTAWARGDHVHPHDSTKADASAIPTPSSAAPAMDGTAAAGSSNDYARADHVHPSDTSKQDALSANQLAAINTIAPVTTGLISVNDSSYIDSCDGTWIKFGNIVIFTVSYTMRSGISSGLGNALKGFPAFNGAIAVLSTNSRSGGIKYLVIENTYGGLVGSHTAGTTYSASGLYITS